MAQDDLRLHACFVVRLFAGRTEGSALRTIHGILHLDGVRRRDKVDIAPNVEALPFSGRPSALSDAGICPHEPDVSLLRNERQV